VDARSLLWQADAFIGAGGTMTREAALLGTPSFTVFGGEEAAVDRQLASRGLLTRMSDPRQIGTVEKRTFTRAAFSDVRRRGAKLRDLVVGETITTAAPRGVPGAVV
jgi:predicted glycosyltransferase